MCLVKLNVQANLFPVAFELAVFTDIFKARSVWVPTVEFSKITLEEGRAVTTLNPITGLDFLCILLSELDLG